MIPEQIIDDVKQSHDLVAFIEGAGIKLRRQGSSYVGLCPFHDDSSSSLAVSPAKQYWCCHGGCSSGGKVVGGDVIEFARRLWGLSFPEAMKRLGGEEIVPVRKLRIVSRRPSLGNAGRELLSKVVASYHQSFLSSLPAKDYLESRGLTDPEILAALSIGYADGSLLEQAPDGTDIHKDLLALGVLATPDRELLADCVVLPLRDLSGQVVNLYGRGIRDDRHRYLPGPRRGLVNAACAATTDEIIFTESIIDALSFLQGGLPNAVPIYGVNGWTKDHDALIEKHRIRKVILALDADDAGRKASQAVAKKLASRGIEARIVTLPASDPNDLLVAKGSEGFAAAWKQALGGASIVSPAPSRPKTQAAQPAAKGAAKKESDGGSSRAPRSWTSSKRSAKPAMKMQDGAYVLSFVARTYRVRGLKAVGMARLKVSVRVEQGDRFHLDTLDLYSARSRRGFLEEAAGVGVP